MASTGPTGCALVVEGGGLRGAFATGVLRALLDQGGRDFFGGIFAVSSGVFAATYFAAGQGDKMENTWRDLVCARQLVDYWQFLTGKPVLRLDYLIDLFRGPVLLDLDRVMSSPAELFYVLTDYNTGEPAYFDAKRPEIFDLMRASSALPLIYPIPVFIDGHPYYDGGQSDAIPVQLAISKGYRKILVVRTRPSSYVKRARSKLLARLLFRNAPVARAQWTKVSERYGTTLKLLDNPPEGVVIHTIEPSKLLVSRLSRSRSRIVAAIEQGKAEARQYIARSDSFFAHSSNRESGLDSLTYPDPPSPMP